MKSRRTNKVLLNLVVGISVLAALFVVKSAAPGEVHAIEDKYVTAYFTNTESVPLNVHFVYLYGDCPNVNYDPSTITGSGCYRIGNPGIMKDGYLPAVNGSSYGFASAYPVLANGENPPYYVWWYATYQSGNQCVDPTDNIPPTEHPLFYRVFISVSCTLPDYTPTPPGSFSVAVYFECSGTNSGIRIIFNGGVSNAATGYKIYWRPTNSSADSPRSSAYYITTTGNLPYTNYTFAPGPSYSIDVAATNSDGDRWSTNGWFWGTIPNCAGAPVPTPTPTPTATPAASPITVKLYASASGVAESDNAISVTSGSTVTLRWTTSGSPDTCSIDNGIGAITTTSSSTQVLNVTSSRIYNATCTKVGTANTTDPVSVFIPSAAPSCGASPNPGTIGGTITFSAFGGSGTYTWSTSGASVNSGSGTTFSTSWSTSGTKTVTITSSGLSGSCTVTINTIAASPSPSPTPTPAPPPPPPPPPDPATTMVVTDVDCWPTASSSRIRVSTYSSEFAYYIGLKDSVTGTVLRYPSSTLTVGMDYNSFRPLVSGRWYTAQMVDGSGVVRRAENVLSATCAAPPPPTADIKANGTGGSIVITYNTAATISWTSTNSSSCSVTKAGAAFGSGTSNAGTSSGNLTANTVFSITCSGTGGTATDSVTVNLGPTNPSGLSVTTACVSGAPQVTFNFSASTNQTGYWLDVNAAAWTSSDTPSPWGVKTLGSASTSFAWSSSNLLDSGTPITPANVTTYYWRLKSFNTYGQGSHVYPPNSAVPPGVSFTTPSCNLPVNLTVSGLPACTAGGYSATLSWGGSAPGWILDVSTQSNFATFSSKSIASVTNTTIPTGLSPVITLQPSTVYYWRINYGSGYVYPPSSGTAPGTGFSVPWCKPSGLTVTPGVACVAGPSYNPSFSWAGAAGSSWWINIDNDNNWSTVEASKQITPGATSTDSTGLLAFAPEVVYRWNIWFGQGAGASAHFIIPPSTEVIGTPPVSTPYVDNRPYLFSVPGCVDLDTSDVESQFEYYTDDTYLTVNSMRNYSAGQAMYIRVNVKNNSAGKITSPFKIAYYRGDGTTAPTLSCTPTGTVPTGSTGATPGMETTFNYSSGSPLAAAGVVTWQFQMAAPASAGAFITNIFVDYGCQIAESNEGNNTGTKAIQVSVNSWFETQGADVGARNGISVTNQPPANKYQSDWLLVSNTIDPKVQSAKWKFSGYTGPLMPTGTYSYLAGRFKPNAVTGRCNFTGLPTGLSLCASNVTLGDDNAAITDIAFPANVSAAWFIDGNLIITDNIVVPASSNIAFIVSGDIKVKTNVSRIDGIYTSGGTFTDITDDSSIQGPQLVVNGSVYADNVLLGRKLGGSLCGAICDNATYPAESFRFEPRFLVNLSNILANPSVSWREVAP